MTQKSVCEAGDQLVLKAAEGEGKVNPVEVSYSGSPRYFWVDADRKSGRRKLFLLSTTTGVISLLLFCFLGTRYSSGYFRSTICRTRHLRGFSSGKRLKGFWKCRVKAGVLEARRASTWQLPATNTARSARKPTKVTSST